MDVLNKLRSTVSSTVSQLSGVLPGNPVTREFEATRHIASCGPGLLWKIYAGYKKSTKQEAAIFVFEKKVLEKYSRRDRETIIENLKKGVSQLTRLRHPKILTVQHPLEESRESLAFATEPVFASLANVLGHHDNLPTPLPPELKGYELYEVEIKYGLLQLSESLAFLHNDVKLLHRNLCPEAVLISKAGAWKVSGFEFCMMNTNPPDQQPFWEFREWDEDLHPQAQPHLDYLAPEYALTLSCDTAADMFSLGALIYSVFNKGRPLYENGGRFSTFKKNACELKSLPPSMLNAVPADIKDYVKMLLNVTPDVRPDAHQFTKISFFEDIGAKTLQYLDSLFQWDNLQKSQFYKGLPQIIAKMPKRVNLYRILPCLLKEFPSVEMIPFVLPNVLLIAEEATKAEFCKLILPALRPVFSLQEPIQILLIFLQKMELLLTKTPAEDIRNHVLPMVYCSLESNAQQIQELCLSIIPGFASLIEYPSMKNALLPRIRKLCLTTPFLSVRVNCLVCIGKLLEHLDKWLVMDDVLPLLSEIPSREPAVLMGILGIYKLTMSHKKLGITKEIMATKVIPFLVPLCIENGLTLNQFNAIISVVKEMIGQVESEHRVKLEQLNSIQIEQKSALEMSKVQPPKKDELIGGLQSKPFTEMDQMFEGLGLGTYLEEKDISKVAGGLTSPTGDGSRPENKVSTASSALTLAEKQHLAAAQEAQQRLRSQPSLKPKSLPSMTQPTTAPPVQPTGPRDLTDTLIKTNLMNMSVPRMPATSAIQPPNYNLGNTFSPGFIGAPAYPSPVPSFGFAPNLTRPGVPSSPMPLTNWGSPQPMNVAMGSFVSAPPVPTVRPDLSAFDSLLQTQPSSAGQPRLSLHQMAQKNTFNSSGNGSVLQGGMGSIKSPTSPSQNSESKLPNSSSCSELSDLLG